MNDIYSAFAIGFSACMALVLLMFYLPIQTQVQNNSEAIKQLQDKHYSIEG